MKDKKFNILSSSQWEQMASKEQLEQRNEIEKIAKAEQIPPSEVEYNLIQQGKIKEDWASVD